MFGKDDSILKLHMQRKIKIKLYFETVYFHHIIPRNGSIKIQKTLNLSVVYMCIKIVSHVKGDEFLAERGAEKSVL
jgi:hypothetical protein